MQKFKVAYIGLNSLFGKISSLLLKQSPFIQCLKLYDEKNIGPALDVSAICTSCKVRAYLGQDQLNNALNEADVVIIGDETNEHETSHDKIFNDAADKIVNYADAISKSAPEAIIIVAASPVNSLLPLLSKVLTDKGTYKSNKVLGSTAADNQCANCILASYLKTNPKQVVVPVVGGSSDESRVPILSHSKPSFTLPKETVDNIVDNIRNKSRYILEAKGMNEALNKAYANVKFFNSIFAGLRGEQNVIDIAMSKTDLVSGVDYFSLPVILGTNGICSRYKLPKLTTFEDELLAKAIQSIKNDVDKASLYLENKLKDKNDQTKDKVIDYSIFQKHSKIKLSTKIDMENKNKTLSNPEEYSKIDLLSGFQNSKSEIKAAMWSIDGTPVSNIVPFVPPTDEEQKQQVTKLESLRENLLKLQDNDSLKSLIKLKFNTKKKRSKKSLPLQNITEVKDKVEKSLQLLRSTYNQDFPSTSAYDILDRFKNRHAADAKNELENSRVTNERGVSVKRERKLVLLPRSHSVYKHHIRRLEVPPSATVSVSSAVTNENTKNINEKLKTTLETDNTLLNQVQNSEPTENGKTSQVVQKEELIGVKNKMKNNNEPEEIKIMFNGKKEIKNLNSTVCADSDSAVQENSSDKRTLEDIQDEKKSSKELSLIKEKPLENISNLNSFVEVPVKALNEPTKPNIFKKDGVISNFLPLGDAANICLKWDGPHKYEQVKQKDKYLIKQRDRVSRIDNKIINSDNSSKTENESVFQALKDSFLKTGLQVPCEANETDGGKEHKAESGNEGKTVVKELRLMDVLLNNSKCSNEKNESFKESSQTDGQLNLTPSNEKDDKATVKLSKNKKIHSLGTSVQQSNEHLKERNNLVASKLEMRRMDVLLNANKEQVIEEDHRREKKKNILRKLSFLSCDRKFISLSDYEKIMAVENEELKKLFTQKIEEMVAKASSVKPRPNTLKRCKRNENVHCLRGQSLINDHSEKDFKSSNPEINKKLNIPNKHPSYSPAFKRCLNESETLENKLNLLMEDISEKKINTNCSGVKQTLVKACKVYNSFKQPKDEYVTSEKESNSIEKDDKASVVVPQLKKIHLLNTCNKSTKNEKYTLKNKSANTTVNTPLVNAAQEKENLTSDELAAESGDKTKEMDETQPSMKKLLYTYTYTPTKYSACQKCVHIKRIENKALRNEPNYEEELMSTENGPYDELKKPPSESRKRKKHREASLESDASFRYIPPAHELLRANIRGKWRPTKPKFIKTKFHILCANQARNSRNYLKYFDLKVKHDYKKDEEPDLAPSEPFDEQKYIIKNNSSKKKNAYNCELQEISDEDTSTTDKKSSEYYSQIDENYDKNWFYGNNVDHDFNQETYKLSPKKYPESPTLYQNLTLKKTFLKKIIDKHKASSKIGTKIQFRCPSVDRKRLKKTKSMFADISSSTLTEIPSSASINEKDLGNTVLIDSLNSTNYMKNNFYRSGDGSLETSLPCSNYLSPEEAILKRCIDNSSTPRSSNFVFDNLPSNEYNKQNNFPSLQHFLQ